MVLVIFRLLFILIAILVIGLFVWKQIRKVFLTNEKNTELEEQLIRIKNEIRIAKETKNEFALNELRKAKKRIEQTIKEGKKL